MLHCRQPTSSVGTSKGLPTWSVQGSISPAKRANISLVAGFVRMFSAHGCWVIRMLSALGCWVVRIRTWLLGCQKSEPGCWVVRMLLVLGCWVVRVRTRLLGCQNVVRTWLLCFQNVRTWLMHVQNVVRSGLLGYQNVASTGLLCQHLSCGRGWTEDSQSPEW